jgi:hypothetical protein
VSLEKLSDMFLSSITIHPNAEIPTIHVCIKHENGHLEMRVHGKAGSQSKPVHADRRTVVQ